MFTTLYSKLAAVLLALFLLVGVALTLSTLYLISGYHEEAVQKLNRPLARHLIEQNHLLEGGGIDASRLKSLFDMQMAINPSIEIFLLDDQGGIKTFSAPAQDIKLDRVALEPIRRFLSQGQPMPILGDDPRHPGERKIFSAAKIGAADKNEGYLYVILANEQHDTMGGLLKGSYVLRVSAGLVLVGLVFAGLAGMLMFAFMTRRLERVVAAMEDFRRSEFSTPPELSLPVEQGDEISRIGHTFREMAVRMAEQLRELKHNDVLRRELVANVSHDLKTPLAALQGYVDTLLIKDASLSEEQRRHYLLVASRSSERLAKLVADLIELAKLDAREVRLSREAFSIAELMQDVAQKLQIKAEQKGLRLDVELPLRPPFVCADIGLIERVLENLLTNAIAHTDAPGSLTLRLGQADNEARIEVADTGCGIPENELHRIFERFYRVNDNQRARGSHAGLGLAITKSILDLHGVGIDVASRPGAGTTFSFNLPIPPPGSMDCAA
jgi:two-component system, OmpR family, sensor kinase